MAAPASWTNRRTPSSARASKSAPWPAVEWRGHLVDSDRGSLGPTVCGQAWGVTGDRRRKDRGSAGLAAAALYAASDLVVGEMAEHSDRGERSMLRRRAIGGSGPITFAYRSLTDAVAKHCDERDRLMHCRRAVWQSSITTFAHRSSNPTLTPICYLSRRSMRSWESDPPAEERPKRGSDSQDRMDQQDDGTIRHLG